MKETANQAVKPYVGFEEEAGGLDLETICETLEGILSG